MAHTNMLYTSNLTDWERRRKQFEIDFKVVVGYFRMTQEDQIFVWSGYRECMNAWSCYRAIAHSLGHSAI